MCRFQQLLCFSTEPAVGPAQPLVSKEPTDLLRKQQEKDRNYHRKDRNNFYFCLNHPLHQWQKCPKLDGAYLSASSCKHRAKWERKEQQGKCQGSVCWESCVAAGKQVPGPLALVTWINMSMGTSQPEPHESTVQPASTSIGKTKSHRKQVSITRLSLANMLVINHKGLAPDGLRLKWESLPFLQHLCTTASFPIPLRFSHTAWAFLDVAQSPDVNERICVLINATLGEPGSSCTCLS